MELVQIYFNFFCKISIITNFLAFFQFFSSIFPPGFRSAYRRRIRNQVGKRMRIHPDPQTCVKDHCKFGHLIPFVCSDEVRTLALDGEEIDLTGPVRLSLLRDRLTVFCREAEARPDPRLADSSAAAIMRRRWGVIGGNSLVAANKHKLG